ncbi:RNA ligase [Acinetobacter apis]|uniref:RNA ligase n=2 Tax=Acinetobacter apis TaxID=1229165 RepID=A0A217EGI9_9GAMM|nr:RNA ligase [Acinetobacter apis]
MIVSKKYKYPRTRHMPFSPGATSDDKMLTEQQFNSYFLNTDILVTEKLDGECSTLARNYMHARSLDSNYHPTRDWLKRFHAEIAHNIPDGWRICGENMFATHSISYDNLASYFYGFSIWDENNICLDVKTTKDWFDLLGITHVPIIKQLNIGTGLSTILNEISNQVVKAGQEGIVIRNINAFHYDDFAQNVAKYVRANHVQSSTHWMHAAIKMNHLKQSDES